jgi:hypothetical protein
MDLSFVGVTSADARHLSDELELLLLKGGVPQEAIVPKSSSTESMDFGSVLGVNIDLVLHTIGAVGYIACFGKCIHEVIAKHNVKIRFETSDGIVEVSGPEATRDLIEKTLARIQSTQKSKSKLKKSK